LLKSRVKLDLVDCGRDACLANSPFDMIAIEVRDAD